MTTLKIRAEGVAWQNIDDDLIVLDERKALYMRLGGAATELWPLLVEGTTIDALSAAIMHKWGIDAAHADQDARAFVKSLEASELLEPVS